MINEKKISQKISSSINDRGAYSSFAEIITVYNSTCKITYRDKNNAKVVLDNVEINPLYLGTTLWKPNKGDIVIIQEMDNHITVTHPIVKNTLNKKKLNSQGTIENTIGGILF